MGDNRVFLYYIILGREEEKRIIYIGGIVLDYKGQFPLAFDLRLFPAFLTNFLPKGGQLIHSHQESGLERRYRVSLLYYIKNKIK